MDKEKQKGDNLIGQRFGKLVVLELCKERAPDRHYLWRCKCDCGNYKNIMGKFLKSGHSKSCGCITKRPYDTKSRLYHIWCGMKQRCFIKKSDAYNNYGGRGIVVCDEWKNDFISFQNWAFDNGYEDNLTIERLNVNDGYNPSNCTWITKEEQACNKRNNHFFVKDGRKRTVADIEKELGLSQGTIYHRLKSGWSVEDAISKTRYNK